MSRRRRLVLLLSLLLGLPLLLVAAAAIFVATFDGSGYRGRVESLLSDATGRACAIESFRIELSMRPRITAAGITLANAAWSDRPDMIAIRRFELEIDAWSLLSGPLHITDVAVDGVEVGLEVNPEAGPNWLLAPVPVGPGGGTESGLLARGLVVDRLMLTDARIGYRDATRDREMTVAGLEAGLQAAGELTLDLDGRLDQAPLALAGRLGPLPHLWQGGGIDLQLHGRLDDATLEVSGSLADLLALRDPVLDLEAKGDALDRLAGHLGLPALGSGPYSLTARITPGQEGLNVILDADLDRFDAHLEGQIDDPLHPSRFAADVSAEGPDLARLGAWLDDERLPPGAFALEGRVLWESGSLAVDNLHAEAGGARGTVGGKVGRLPDLAGTDLKLELAGPDLSTWSALAGVGLPHLPFGASGRAAWADDGIRLESVKARLGETTAQVDGVLGPLPDLEGTDLKVRAEGPDLAAVGDVADIELPTGSFEVSGRLRRIGGGYAFEAVDAHLADSRGSGSGRLVLAASGFSLTLDGRVQAPDLAALLGRVLQPYLGALPPLPDEAVDVAGGFRMDPVGYRVEGLQITLADAALTATGRIGREPDLDGLDATFSVHAASLDLLAPYLDIPPLPAGEIDLAGRVTGTAGSYALHEVSGSLGPNRFGLDAGLGHPADLPMGLEATFDVSGPDLSAFDDLDPRLPLPALPYSASGQITRDEAGWVFERVRGGIGDHRFAVDGRLGEPPELIGTDLSAQADGPTLAAWAPTFGVEDIPDQPYDMQVRFEGTPSSFRLNDLSVHLGESDLSGSGSLDWVEPPRVKAAFASHRLDLTPLIRIPGVTPPGEEQPPTSSDGVETEGAGSSRKKRIFSDTPLDLEALKKVDADVRFDGDTVIWQGQTLTSAELDLGLEDGALSLNRLAATGPGGARVSGRLGIQPVAEGYHISLGAEGRDIRISLLGSSGIPRDQKAPYRVDVDLEGRGATPRQLMAGLSGHLWVLEGSGLGDNTILERLSADVLLQVLSILNPFAKQEKSSRVECGIYAIDVEGGVARLDAMVQRTDKVTVGGQGRINLGSEKIDLTWTSKPRKGIGLSASSLVNSYIKLGGTLAQPQVEIKPLEAAVTTGAAVATAGLSIAARGLWDRITAEKNPCKKGVPALERRMDEEERRQGGSESRGRN